MMVTIVMTRGEWNENSVLACGLIRNSPLKKSFRRNREPVFIQYLRQQLQDQIKCLDCRMEDQEGMLGELVEFYKKKSEVEMDYAKSLDKLVRQTMARHKTDKRETWPGYSTYSIWQTLLSTTKKVSKDHMTLSDLYSSKMTLRFSDLLEDTHRIYKKCKEIAVQHQGELIKSLYELQSTMKTFNLYQNEKMIAEDKLKQVEKEKMKVVGSSGGKISVNRRMRNLEKQMEKKQLKFMDNRLRALKSKNEYLLSLESSNASVNKYFTHDLHKILSAIDLNYHKTLTSIMGQHISAEENLIQSRTGCMDLLMKRNRDVLHKLDKQNLFDLYPSIFQQPKPFEFQKLNKDEGHQLTINNAVQDDLVERLRSISERLNCLKLENDELRKTLDSAESRMEDMINREKRDVSDQFQEQTSLPQISPLERDKFRSDKIETEEFYLNKFNNYQMSSNLMSRLQAKYHFIEKSLTSLGSLSSAGMSDLTEKSTKKMALNSVLPLSSSPSLSFLPPLFGGSIPEYVEASGEDIPLIVKSCIHMINLYGMHHQGLFRISGSQSEINDFKNQFEQGKDPLPEKVGSKDLNSVAGVLKLYFRELREPLFPFYIFDKLIEFVSCFSFNSSDDLIECINKLRVLLMGNLPKSVLVVMHYIFAFLNHLSEFSDENMMDVYNLSIIFGPTLMPIPPDKDQVLYQNHITELMKNIISHQEVIFPHFPGSTEYERCQVQISRKQLFSEVLSDEDEIIDEVASENDLDTLRAVAMFDFEGRTERELTFKKGQSIQVFERVSSDWWEGKVDGKEGLVPHKYITVKSRLRSKEYTSENYEEQGKFKSTESLPLNPINVTLASCDDFSPMSASHPNLELKIIQQQHQKKLLQQNTFERPQQVSHQFQQQCSQQSHYQQQSQNFQQQKLFYHNHLIYQQQQKQFLIQKQQNNQELLQKQNQHNRKHSSSSSKSENIQTSSYEQKKSELVTNIKATTSLSPKLHSKQQYQHINNSVFLNHKKKKDNSSNEINININNNNLSSNEKANHSIGDLSAEIETALAEVMMSIRSMESTGDEKEEKENKKEKEKEKDKDKKEKEKKKGKKKSDQIPLTPDLVNDLPFSSSSSSFSVLSTTKKSLTSAEMFALADQSTIRKSGKNEEILKISSISSKKYSTLGKTDAKKSEVRNNLRIEGIDLEKNSFGKPKAPNPPKNFLPPFSFPTPPTRTTSKLTTCEAEKDTTVLRNNNYNSNSNSVIKQTGYITSITSSNNTSYGKSKISLYEIPKLQISPQQQPTYPFHQQDQRHTLFSFNPTSSSHLNRNQTSNPVPSKVKPPISKKPTKELARRMTIDSPHISSVATVTSDNNFDSLNNKNF